MADRDLERLQDELEQLFGDLWRIPRFSGARRGFRPHVDVLRSGEPPELTVVCDLAGVDPEHLQIVVSDRTLLIAGERLRPQPDCAHSYHQLEVEYGPFQRRVSLPEAVDAQGSQARYERGLLTIVLPIVEQRPASEAQVLIHVQLRR